MLPAVELLFAAGLVGIGGPTVASTNRLGTAGACPSTAATLTVSAVVTNPDDTNFEAHILENGVLVATTLTSSVSWLKTLTGYVQNGAYNRYTSSWIYTIQIVRKADGVVVSSRATPAWSVTYGTCTP